jgi:hypothetical protein
VLSVQTLSLINGFEASPHMKLMAVAHSASDTVASVLWSQTREAKNFLVKSDRFLHVFCRSPLIYEELNAP